MKLWLVSYPRSGNTFFRNVLHACYGIESSTYHHETTYALEENFDTYDIVKTHLLPHELPSHLKHVPKVYIVRDGRDALVSMAHHKKDLIDIHSDFNGNIQEITLAAAGSHFGGWSQHVDAWIIAADIIIRFEDLIANPIQEIERIRAIFSLPEPDITKLPQFASLQQGNAAYGSGKYHNITGDDVSSFSKKNFRKGKVGSWKEELTEFEHDLFWNYHGDTMLRMGYMYNGEIHLPDTFCMSAVLRKMGLVSAPYATSKKILIDASKITGTTTDGIKRYVIELLRMYKKIASYSDSIFTIHLYIHGKIYALQDVELLIDAPEDKSKPYFFYERVLLFIRKAIQWLLPKKLYHRLSPYYRHSGIREKLLLIRESVSGNVFYSKIVNRDKNKNNSITYDLIHITLPQHMDIIDLVPLQCVVTVHDLAHRVCPEFLLENNKVLAEKGMERCIQKNASIIAVSNATKETLIHQYKKLSNTIKVIGEAVNTQLFRHNRNQHLFEETCSRYQIQADIPYFLCLSTIEPRKNIASVIKAFNQLIQYYKQPIQLVIAGKKGWMYDDLHHDAFTSPHIVFTGFVRDRDLAALYSGAIAFCYISHYEGFGLPLLEAMSCRVPLIYGNNSSQIELCESAGIAISNAKDTKEIEQAMYKMTNDDIREAYANAAWKKSFQYSWYACAKETLAYYNSIIDSA